MRDSGTATETHMVFWETVPPGVCVSGVFCSKGPKMEVCQIGALPGASICGQKVAILSPKPRQLTIYDSR